jgi:serine protease Do
MKSNARLSAAVLALVTIISGCGGGSDQPTVTTVVASSVVAVPTTLSGQSLATMKGAIVQVIVQGEIRDPANGSVGFSSSGSGFIVSESGLIVTNNHVVTGAGAISVLVGGDKTTEIPARVLGVSECSDLAVIQLGNPGKYPFLKWSKKVVEPPLEIYAAGFPLGDPEYTVTRGVVSKAKADGDTNWASVVHVIEHDANIQPGNSGGPLVDVDGAVIGVNYAGGDKGDTGTAQFFAIANDLAQPTVEALAKGDQESIGVNGRAFVDVEANLAGVFVRGVAPGGAASNAEVKPGDIITTLNGVELSGGSYSQYCKVLRSARANTPISIRVVRLDSQQVLEGELNGKPLKPVFSFAQKLGGEIPAGGGTGEALSGKFVRVTDSTGRLSVEVPVEWNETNLQPTDLDGVQAPTIIASPDLARFQGQGVQGSGEQLMLLDAPGVGSVDKDQLLDTLEQDNSANCEPGKREDFADDRYTGRFLVVKCGAVLAVVAIVNPVGNADQVIILLAQAETDADLAAADRMLDTFEAR